LNGGRRSWLKNMHMAFIPSTGGIYWWSWRSFMGKCPGLRANASLRLCNCHRQSWKFLMPWLTWACSTFENPFTTEVSSGCPDGGEPYFGASIGGTCLRRWSLGLKLSLFGIATAPGYPTCRLFLCFWRVCNVHIYISTYVNIQKNSCHYIPAPLAATSWGS
jgi:hypothetical protein